MGTTSVPVRTLGRPNRQVLSFLFLEGRIAIRPNLIAPSPGELATDKTEIQHDNGVPAQPTHRGGSSRLHLNVKYLFDVITMANL